MLTTVDKKGNRARVQFNPSNERKEHWLITFEFKHTTQTKWEASEEDAKATIELVLGRVEWQKPTGN